MSITRRTLLKLAGLAPAAKIVGIQIAHAEDRAFRHALVELGRLLTSRIEFREFAPGKPLPQEEMLLADGRLLLERGGHEALEAKLVREDPATARERQRRFDNLWDHAVPSAELRRLSV